MELTDYKVICIRSSRYIHNLGHKAEIIDEGSFYRISGTYIIDKYKILSILHNEDKITIQLQNEQIVLTVEKNKSI